MHYSLCTCNIPWMTFSVMNPTYPPNLAIIGLKKEQAVAPIAETSMTFLELYISAKYPPGSIVIMKP